MRGANLIFVIIWQVISITLSIASMMSVFEEQIQWQDTFQNFITAYQNVFFPFWDAVFGVLPIHISPEHRELTYNLSLIWSVMIISLNMVMLMDGDVRSSWLTLYPRFVKSAFRDSHNVFTLITSIPKFILLNIFFLLSLIFPPFFLLINGILGGSWSEFRSFTIYLGTLVLLFFIIVAANYQLG